MSAWRRAVAGDLTSCFRAATQEDSSLHYVDRDKHIELIVSARHKEMPTGYKELSENDAAAITANPRKAVAISHQEPGTRPSCSLPYELYAHGSVTLDGKHFQLELTAAKNVFGARSAGAPFNVYLRNLAKEPGMQAATYSVLAG